MNNVDKNLIGKLTKISIIEGISLIILLFIAVPIKYILGYKVATIIMGSIHGTLWLIFLYVLNEARVKNNFDKKLIIKLIIYSVIPFGFILIERELKSLL